MAQFEGEFYSSRDLEGKTPAEVADMIKVWREDEDQAFSHSFDLLNSIEPYLRALPERK